jgi:hypothetical protein
MLADIWFSCRPWVVMPGPGALAVAAEGEHGQRDEGLRGT